MDEARRFVRYLIPGVTFMVELGILLAISLSAHPYGWSSIWDHLPAIKLATGVGASVLVVLGSAGIGGLLNALHNVIYWFPFSYGWLAVDHRPTFIDLVDRGWLDFELQRPARQPGSRWIAERLTRQAAGRIEATLINERRESSDLVRGGVHGMERLHDFMHGSGTALAGAIVAFLVSLLIHCGIRALEGTARWAFFAPALGVVFVVVHASNLCHLRRESEGTERTVLSDALGEKAGVPVVVVRESDLDAPWRRLIAFLAVISLVLAVLVVALVRQYGGQPS